jgi:DNA-binding IclR family transcriptional regulator
VISKISAILLTAAEGRYTSTDIAARAELPLSTVHRLVGELAAWGLTERGECGRYRRPTARSRRWPSSGRWAARRVPVGLPGPA